ncbi:hypothetical protein HAX54_032335 [Datura stramonium]|uniref:Uncharacterized protein n=1 Tax=Datura stramonium TaxID=4076 RepID=A0ABS8VCH1_DATST|nr:hypothetical protein [Datura stramonium]
MSIIDSLICNLRGSLMHLALVIGSVFGPEFLLKLYLSGAVAGSVFYLVYHAFMAPSLQKKKKIKCKSSVNCRFSLPYVRVQVEILIGLLF